MSVPIAPGGRSTGRLGLWTLARFYIGDADAIRAVAGSRGALWFGLAFVLIAGLAREYDQKDLLAEAWWLAVPLLVSVALATVQFVCFWVLRASHSTLRAGEAFRGFLTCFWMTAPLALLYAIPYERWNDEMGAVASNYNTLVVVSVWRGLLICRVLMVLAHVGFLHAFLVVALLGDAALLIALAVMPVPIFDVMGGLSYSPAVADMASRAFFARFFGVAALVVLLPGGLYWLGAGRPAWTEGSIHRGRRLHPLLWALPAAALAGFLAALPYTQPPQRLAQRATHLLVAGRLDDAVAFMDQHPREAFPPHWHPLPVRGLPIRQPDLLDVTERAARLETDSWVRAFYLEETFRIYLGRHLFYGPVEETELERFLALLETVPQWKEKREIHAEEISRIRHAIIEARARSSTSTAPATQPQ